MPNFHSDPNKYKKAMDNNMSPTKKPRFFSWVLIFILFFSIVFISIISRSNTSRVIQTQSRKLVDGMIFELTSQDEIYVGNCIDYKVKISSDVFKKIQVKSFDTYIVYEGKKVFEYPSQEYSGPDTISTDIDGNDYKLIFSNKAFPYYPSAEGTYTIFVDSYINDTFVQLKKQVVILHKSPLNISSNSFFFPGQTISGDIYLHNPYQGLKTFKVSYVQISINGESRKKSLNEKFTLTNNANVKIADIQDSYPINIGKEGSYVIKISSEINGRIETLQYPVYIINKDSLSDSQDIEINISVNKYSYKVGDPLWFESFVVNNSQSTKYFKINSCSVLVEYKQTVIKKINIPINRNFILNSFERLKLFDSKLWWQDLKITDPYTIIFSIDFVGKDSKQISGKYIIKM